MGKRLNPLQRELTLESLRIIAAMTSNALLNCIRSEFEKILRKSPHGFRRNRSPTFQMLTIRGIIEAVRVKNIVATQSVDFSMALDSIHRGKIEQILLACGLHTETFTDIIMLYKNMKVMVRLHDSDTDFFDIVAWVLQRDTLAPYMFIICLYHALQTSIDLVKLDSFSLKRREVDDIPQK